MSKPYQDEDTLRELYYDKQLSTVEIGEKFDIDQKTVYYWMKKHDIETRSPEEGNKIASRKKSSPILKDKDSLYELYVKEEKTVGEIAGLADTSQATVSDWLKRHGIETRQPYPDTPEEVYNEDLLRELYFDKELNTYEMGEYFGCSQYPILEAMEEYGIERRDRSESAKVAMQYQAPKVCKHPEALRYLYEDKRLTTVEIAEYAGCWPGVIGKWLARYGIEMHHGASEDSEYVPYYGPEWPEIRREILSRDGEQCRVCGLTNEDQREKYNTSLAVHHITPKERFRTNGEVEWDKANSLNNLITVCSQCHPRCERMAPLLPTDVSV